MASHGGLPTRGSFPDMTLDAGAWLRMNAIQLGVNVLIRREMQGHGFAWRPSN